MPVSIPCVIMRGGTSKCLMFLAKDLPAERAQRDAFLLAAMGSPDPRQIDGLGGAYSTTSKVCIVGPPSVRGADVDYTFAQVSITAALVDYKGNCGNCSSAVGPFALDEGLIRAVAPTTTIRIYNTNTKKIIRAEVPVRNGRYDPEGSTYISGVPGAGSAVRLWFDEPAGAVTGKLLPTGSPVDVVPVPGVGTVPISVVDAANPVAFIHGSHLGVNGTESPAELDADKEFCARIEAVRATAAVLCGLVPAWQQATVLSPAVPKVAFVMEPRDYHDLSGNMVMGEHMDILARIMSMQTCNRTYALTGAVATCTAAFIPGTVIWEMAPKAARQQNRLRIGHPGGILEMTAQVQVTAGGVEVLSVGSVRTARRIMDGYVHLPGRLLSLPAAEVASALDPG